MTCKKEAWYLDSLGWAGTFGLVLAHKRRSHSPPSSAGLASVWLRTPHTNTPPAAHTAAAGSSPGPLHTSTLEQEAQIKHPLLEASFYSRPLAPTSHLHLTLMI